MSSVLFIFPGQGAQYPKIGSDLFAEFEICRQVYETASETLGYSMTELSSDTSSDRIHLTKFTQPVLLTHSYACLSVFLDLVENEIVPAFACGHSLGEYSALLAAESLTFESALRLVSVRGQYMSECSGGDMLALAMTPAKIAPFLKSSGCEIAACNLPLQTVVGGWPKNIDHLLELLAQSTGKTGVRLKTEGAFHTSQMKPAAEKFRRELDAAHFAPPKCPVASNTTGSFHADKPDEIRDNLYRQLFQPVKWHENLMQIASSGVNVIIEFGGGIGGGDDPATKRPNLASMVTRVFRRSKPRPKYYSVINLKSLYRTCEQLGSGAVL